jgi:hypothetical protein
MRMTGRRFILFLAVLFVGDVGVTPMQGRAEANVTGIWDMTIEAERASEGDAVLSLRQEGQNLTGSYKGRMGETKLTGTVRENNIRFSVSLRFRDISFTVTYSGVVEDGRMQGKADFGNGKTGTWKAKRRP